MSLTGKVIGPVTGDSHTPRRPSVQAAQHQRPSPIVPIVYQGSVPDLFKVGRDVNLTGASQGGSFVATALTTKCPSKYTRRTRAPADG